MRVFYDTEFIERGPDIPIVPVSLGFVGEDGRELYVINEECLSRVMNHPWLSVNVVPHLPISTDQHDVGSFISEWDAQHPEYGNVVSLDTLRAAVRVFLQSYEELELWGDYAAYDHVVLCQLFGTMAELPSGIPMFTRDIQQLLTMYPDVKLPSQSGNVHHSLHDARWTRDMYMAITQSA